MLTDSGFGRRKSKDDGDLDITPMIDVTFLLLIFFMVTSTMKGTPDKDIPPSSSGTNANAGGFVNVAIMAPKSAGSESELQLDGNTVTLDQFKEQLSQKTVEGPMEIMIYAERDVKSGFVGEVEGIIGEVIGEEEAEIEYKFAVQDRR